MGMTELRSLQADVVSIERRVKELRDRVGVGPRSDALNRGVLPAVARLHDEILRAANVFDAAV